MDLVWFIPPSMAYVWLACWCVCQVLVLELETRLQKERERLGELRKKHYELAGVAEGWGEEEGKRTEQWAQALQENNPKNDQLSLVFTGSVWVQPVCSSLVPENTGSCPSVCTRPHLSPFLHRFSAACLSLFGCDLSQIWRCALSSRPHRTPQLEARVEASGKIMVTYTHFLFCAISLLNWFPFVFVFFFYSKHN